MSAIKFSVEERAALLPKIQAYCRDELDRELGGFEAEFLLDFFWSRSARRSTTEPSSMLKA